MEMSPQEAAHYARLNATDRFYYLSTIRYRQEKERQHKIMREELIEALKCIDEGKDHPRLWTKARKAEQRERRRLRDIAMETSKRPPLPQIIVTKKVDDYDWRDFTNTIRGRFGAIRQE